MVVAILVFVDVATLTTWQIVDPFYREISKGTPEVMCQKSKKVMPISAII